MEVAGVAALAFAAVVSDFKNLRSNEAQRALKLTTTSKEKNGACTCSAAQQRCIRRQSSQRYACDGPELIRYSALLCCPLWW
jgi:hypothetical protein